MPSFGTVSYVVVSEDEVALVKTKTGAFKMKISDKVLAVIPRRHPHQRTRPAAVSCSSDAGCSRNTQADPSTVRAPGRRGTARR
jgi:hypothetical protein